MLNRSTGRRLVIGTLMPLLFAPAFALAQSFATKPVRIVTPFARMNVWMRSISWAGMPSVMQITVPMPAATAS